MIVSGWRLFCIGLFVGGWHSTLSAQQVTFDVPRTVACSVQEQEDTTSRVKRIETELTVSVILTGDASRALVQCEFEVCSLGSFLQVVDYAPKTELVTDIRGAVAVAEESRQQAGRQVGGGGSVDGVVHGEASASSSNHDSNSLHFEQLPNRDLLTTSGTTQRGTGLFFKLRKTSQTSLEGTHQLRMVWEVPSNWRAGAIRLVCRPLLSDQGKVHTSPAQSFLVPLYLQGDEEAHELAEQLIAAQHHLLLLARSRTAQVNGAKLPSLAHLLSLTEPELPAQWLEIALWQEPDAGPLEFAAALPPEVRRAVERYTEIRRVIQREGATQRPESDGLMALQ